MTREQFQPREVHKIEETGLSNGMLAELCLKHIFFEGQVLLRTLADRTKLSPGVILALFRQFQKEQLVETHGMVGEATKAPRYVLSSCAASTMRATS